MEYDNSIYTIQQQMMLNLMQDSNSSDVTFIVGNSEETDEKKNDNNVHEFHVHRLILSTISPSFKNMLYGPMLEGTSDKPIPLPDINKAAFQSVLNFAYCNDPKIDSNNVFDVRQICNMYLISSLQQICDKYIIKLLQSTNNANFVILFDKIVKLDDDTLIKNALTLMGNTRSLDYNKILASNNFKKISFGAVKILIQTDECKIFINKNIWYCLMTWVEYQVRSNLIEKKEQKSDKNDIDLQKRKCLLKQLAPFIPFAYMNPFFFNQTILELNGKLDFLTKDDISNFLLLQTSKNTERQKAEIQKKMPVFDIVYFRRTTWSIPRYSDASHYNGDEDIMCMKPLLDGFELTGIGIFCGSGDTTAAVSIELDGKSVGGGYNYYKRTNMDHNVTELKLDEKIPLIKNKEYVIRLKQSGSKSLIHRNGRGTVKFENIGCYDKRFFSFYNYYQHEYSCGARTHEGGGVLPCVYATRKFV